ncbi:PREDICTED: E3 ubiquitin-protein ligase UBR1 [Populus euphratica]|uniref:E3 ubiquitin-protein ligase n=1 Tax=Populus euphratica TaxID=75702 RepID=A0AAJ6U024_POPEU|nr:PREDICTED: E3 ubiquitin-protein ligase UBR1 [Populus euphratica]XP_011019865.1 PREDICTED: E3 ubiquitin-protein ligase UBR1 [Populus euphratica]XP_011019866.1 PREDICTED: E3 ubiquitin-protein ligase UBR1 [Populus euphratica]
MTDSMDIDLPPESASSIGPRDLLLLRLTQFGVPKEYRVMLHSGLVDYIMDNWSRIPELVAAILPIDDEMAEILLNAKLASKKSADQTMEYYFRECMVWLQWLMFLGQPAVALKNLSKMSAGRGVCGAVWGNNDIAYRCQTCEHDPTCAICVPCFQNGNHKDHDYSIIYTGGGCCDCGDVTAWKREGFCSKHKGTEQIKPLPEEFARSVGPVLDALLGCWKNKLVSAETISQKNPNAADSAVMCEEIANQLTVAVVEMLLEFCKCSESLLSFVSRRVISLGGLLEILVRAERFLSEGVVKKLHELLLKLLGEPIFKYEFAKEFLRYYPFVVHEAMKESVDDTHVKYSLLSIFSVQIFTVPTLTPRLVKEMNLLGLLLGCLEDLFIQCAGEDGRLQFTKWAHLYEIGIRVVEDVRFVMSHGVVQKNVTHVQRAVLRTWMELLSFLQGMGPLKRETGLYVEEESENINLLFVLGHSIANIHYLLVDGAFSMSEEADDVTFLNIHGKDMDEQDSMRHTKIGRLSQESSVCSVTESTSFISAEKVVEVDSDSTYRHLLPSSVMWLTYECLRAIENCLGADDSFGAQVSGDTSSISVSNFPAFEKKLCKIREGKYIFGGHGSTRKDECSSVAYSSCHASVNVDNANVVKDCKTTVPGDTDYSGSSDSLMEGSSSSDLGLLRFLSLSDWPDIIYDVSSRDVSVHTPLHRLLSMLLHKALRRCYGGSVVMNAINASTSTSLSRTDDDFFGCLLEGCHPCGFSAFVMEHPLRNRVFCAQVHAGMWRKNGDAAILCCEWYRSVRWSEQGLEFDLFLLQCCAALAPPDLYVSRILERFGLSYYLSLKAKQSTEYEPVLMQEMLTLLIQIVQERRFSGLTPAENLKRELVHKLAIGDATRSQLVKSLPRDLSKIDQLQEVLDTVAVFSNPSGFNQGMYSLRWAYWKELDLYHPRWNSRDLQVAEERYLRYCSASAGTTQLPRWTDIYPPLKGVARIASSKVVIKIIRAVLFYAIFMHKRVPDGVLLSALHLLSLALDICIQQKEMDMSFHIENSTSMFGFVGEEIQEGLNYSSGGQSLLSLLVLLMRIHKRESSDNLLEAGSYNLSSLIESLLKRFAEIDAGCMTKLQQLAPEMAIHLSQSVPNIEKNTLGSASDSEKRKAKALERQAAILAKMKAEQSKFLSSMNSATDDVPNTGAEEIDSDGTQKLEESTQDVCSLCHDPNSKNPVSFLILLQKSRLLSFIDRGPPSWDRDQLPDKEQNSVIAKALTNQSGISSSSGSGMISSTQLTHFVQDVVNQFSNYAQPGEVNAIIEFIKARARFPLLRSSQVSSASKDGKDRTMNTFEMLEQDMYFSMRKEMHDNMLVSNSGLQTEKFTAAEGVQISSPVESVLLGKYIAALSREITEHPSSSESAPNDEIQAEFPSRSLTYDGFGPADCDGVHLSSCGHAVHQECLDRYLSSLKERHVRRIVFEGGHIVDPDQGEFLCPVCRQLANSVLPSLPGDFQKLWRQPMISTVSSLHAVGPLVSSSEGCDSLQLQHALFLLKSAAKIVEKGDILKSIPLQRGQKIWPNLDSISRLLIKLYFPNRWDKFSGSARVNHSMIMWDTLKYSLVSMEIAARCGGTHLTPTYSLNALYKELKSTSGFTLSLLLKIVQNLRSKNPLHVLQRFRGIQLFAESICSGVPNDYPSGAYRCGENMSCILAHIGKEVSYSDVQFWNWVAEPVLAHDAFSSLMWALFCLPCPFLSCQDSLLSLIHVFYCASVAQAIVIFCGKHQREMRESNFDDSLITDISKVFGESGCIKDYFVSVNIDSSSDIINVIRRLSFPYLRRCALLWKLLSTSVSAPFCDRDVLNRSSNAVNYMDNMSGAQDELNDVQELEKMFKIPPLFFVLKDHTLRSLVTKWLHHFCKQYEVFSPQHVLHVTPAVPFKLMHLPHVYQDLLQRYIKQKCVGCKTVLDDPALCLFCGRVCSLNWKSCCRESGCQTHAMACGAGTGVFLLIKRTTILLQRCARQSPWPSPYLDAFGEEDIQILRGKPLYLNEERYAALAYMVASHGLDRSSKVLGQTTIGSLFLV